MSHYLRVWDEKSENEKLPPFAWLSKACGVAAPSFGSGGPLFAVPAASAPSTVRDSSYAYLKRDGTRAKEISAVVLTCCPCQRPEFNSQLPHQAVHNPL